MCKEERRKTVQRNVQVKQVEEREKEGEKEVE